MPTNKKKPAKKPAKKPSKKPAKGKKPAAKKSKSAPAVGGVSQQVLLHLGQKKISFEVVPHKKVFTAYDLAQTLGEKLDNIAKTLLVEVELPKVEKAGKRNYVVVLPASYRVNLQKLKQAVKASKVTLATEQMMAKLGIKPGALTPFGSLRQLGVVIDKNLVKAKKVLVGAESFTESLRVTVKDLAKAEDAIVAAIGDRSQLKIQHPAKGQKKPIKRVAKGKPKVQGKKGKAKAQSKKGKAKR